MESFLLHNNILITTTTSTKLLNKEHEKNIVFSVANAVLTRPNLLFTKKQSEDAKSLMYDQKGKVVNITKGKVNIGQNSVPPIPKFPAPRIVFLANTTFTILNVLLQASQN